MTGDGAVVRDDAPLELIPWLEWRVEYCKAHFDLKQTARYKGYLAHARQQAAEIERLTDNRRGLKRLLEAEGTALMQWKARAEASEARNADLLKAARALLAHDGGDGADYHAFKYGEAREQLWLLVADKKRPAQRQP